MNPTTPDIPTIVGEALEIASPAEREAYLHRVCGRDGTLRSRVDQLLEHHAAAGDFLEQPAVRGLESGTEESQILGQFIGPYRLMEQIGEGGMGIVYVAEQVEPIRRRVALKIIKPGMDTRQVIGRFDAERQALALMHHPNIAGILDAGATDGGHPFFVMELVRGIPITQFCDRSRYTLRQRLELFLQVGLAVQHAHQKGVIHRDLKPSNVLVELHDVTAVVKVIDFGIAKAIREPLSERTIYTRFAQTLGTPLYMSPEQTHLSGLDVDTRSDVYSLGVLLYELLTGTTPFEFEKLVDGPPDEMWRIIREVEPPRPSVRVSTLQARRLATVLDERQSDVRQLAVSMRRELDWIVLKALEKDRSQRYESAAALVADVRRYLNDEPVEACPPSMGYRARKLMRRHRRLLLVAGVLVATLIAATAVSVNYALVANQERDAARRERVRAQEAEALADSRLAQSRRDLSRALQSLDIMIGDITSAEFGELPQAERIRREVLRETLELYEQIATEHDELPQVRRQQALAWMRISTMLATERRIAESVKAMDRAVSIIDGLIEEYPDVVDYQHVLLDILFQRAYNSGRPAALQKQDAERSLAIAEALLPTATPDTLNRYLHVFQIMAFNLPEDSPRATALLERSIQIAEGHGIDPLPGALMALAGRQARQGSLERAAESARRGVALFETVAKDALKRDRHVEQNLVGENSAFLGSLLERMGRRDEAVQVYRAALQASLTVCRDYRQNLAYRGALRRHAAELIRLLRLSGDSAAADAVLPDLLQEFPEFPELHAMSAEFLRSESSAESLLTDAIASHPAQTAYLRERGAVRLMRGDTDAALADLNQALGLATDRGSREEVLGLRGRLYLDLRQYDRAEADFLEAMRASDSFHYYKLLGTVHFYQGRFSECLVQLREGIERKPDDLNMLTWIPREAIAACPEHSFQTGFLALADWVVERNRNSAASLATRAAVRVALGETVGGMADVESILKSAAPGHLPLYQAALIAWECHRPDVCRQICSRLRADFGGSHDPETLAFVAWTCVLLPDAVDDWGPAVESATRAVELNPEKPFYLISLGATLVRSGRARDALEPLNRACRSVGESTTSVAYAWYFQVLAHQQAGDRERASEALQRANELAQPDLQQSQGYRWNRRLTQRLLRAEAERSAAEVSSGPIELSTPGRVESIP